MGAVDEDDDVIERPQAPAAVPPNSQFHAKAASFAAPPASDWREEEIRQLRAAICRSVPPAGDKYWRDNAVWVGCVDASLDKSAGSGDFVRLAFKATTENDEGDIWGYYERHKAEIHAAVRSALPDGNIKIVGVTAEKGSVTLFILIQITIGLVGLALAVLANFDNIQRNFRRAMPYIRQYATDVVSTVKNFFRGFGFGSA